MAGVSTKEIKNRIRSMESTRQITKAMEMVASSKLRKAQNRALQTRPYFEILSETIRQIVDTNGEFASPYFSGKENARAVYVVFAGDRGLAGGYNSNIFKAVQASLDADSLVLPVGKKAVEFFKNKNIPLITQNYGAAEEVSVGDCYSLAKHLCQMYLSGEVNEVYVAYTQCVSVLSQVPMQKKLLPLEKQENTQTLQQETLYEGGSEAVFNAIVPEYLAGILYGALCESRASEQAARRTAMDAATQNAEEMIADLSLQFNRARQAAITQEITEIVAGS